MLAKYEDIKKRIKDKILWFDSNGVPRYDKFHPELSPNIYADEVILMEISCQECGQIFNVEMNWDGMKDIKSFSGNVERLHYGDPPRHESCSAGDTMNCNDLRIIEFWKRENMSWTRKNEFEITID